MTAQHGMVTCTLQSAHICLGARMVDNSKSLPFLASAALSVSQPDIFQTLVLGFQTLRDLIHSRTPTAYMTLQSL